MQILVKHEDLHSGDKYDLIYSIIEYVNELLVAHYLAQEIPAEALYSYYVDYYLQQILNGGVSQFVYNSNWNPLAIDFVQNGLQVMKAEKNLELFSKINSAVTSLGNDLTQFVTGDYFETRTDIRDFLNKFNDEFYNLQETEDLVEINFNFICGLPNLEVLSNSDWRTQLKKLCDSVPDKENRLRQAAENEPEHIKIIKCLCKEAGQELVKLNAGSFGEYKGNKVFEMHITTTSGHHFAVILDNSALLFDGTSRELVKEIMV